MNNVDLSLVDDLCLQMKQNADTIEKFIGGKKYQTAVVDGLTEMVFETRKQLTELMSLKNKECLGGKRIALFADLVKRYECLEGTLKDRNDSSKKPTVTNQEKESVQ